MKPKETYEAEILEVIKKHNLFVIRDIFAFYTGCCRATFYELDLDKSESILKALDDNKVKTCQSLKQKWFKSKSASLQIALFKLLASEEDRKAIVMNYADFTSNGKDFIPARTLTKEEAKELLQNLENDC